MGRRTSPGLLVEAEARVHERTAPASSDILVLPEIENIAVTLAKRHGRLAVHSFKRPAEMSAVIESALIRDIRGVTVCVANHPVCML